MRGKQPLQGPLAVNVTALMPVPASWSNKKRDAALAGTIRPTGRPDCDNIFKVVDALNKIVWLDDAQIVEARAVKFYSESPALRIEVQPVGEF